MGNFKIELAPTEYLSRYSEVPISFMVRSILSIEPIDNGLGGFNMAETPVEPWTKDYDSFELPSEWARRWDISNWAIYRVCLDGRMVGGMVVAHDTPGVLKLEDRKDIAAIWDIRIHPDHRNQGIGSQLFQTAVRCAQQKKCVFLKVETQNINVPACRFYHKNGCFLSSVNLCAYSDFSDEAEMVWCKRIAP